MTARKLFEHEPFTLVIIIVVAMLAIVVFVQIGSHCSIYSVSTIDDKEGTVTLKENCKIGTHSVIMPGVIVGQNSIIGAFSFVNKDIPDNVTAVGVPAKVIKKVDPIHVKTEK